MAKSPPLNIDSFTKSIGGSAPPEGLDVAVQALWWDAKGDWDKAHELADRRHDAAGSRVHAYLHRKEGDIGNARYWYGRARQRMPSKMPLDAEWLEIVKALTGG